jgi:hypothetical protein
MKSLKVFFIISVVILSFSACTNVEDEIIGTWNFQTFNTSPQGTVTWTFKDNGELIRMIVVDSEIHFDSCNYIIDKSIFKKQITISGSEMLPGQDDVNGLFRIDKFKDDILIMTRERLDDDETAGAYLRCEMIRKQ